MENRQITALKELEDYKKKSKKGNRVNKKFVYCSQCGIYEQIQKEVSK